MFVTDNTIFNASSVKIRITSLDGVSIVLDVDANLTIDTLKIDAVGQLFDTPEGAKLSLYYNLVHVRTDRQLSGDATVSQAEIADNGNSMLVVIR